MLGTLICVGNHSLCCSARVDRCIPHPRPCHLFIPSFSHKSSHQRRHHMSFAVSDKVVLLSTQCSRIPPHHSFIHSFIPAISIAPLQVLYYSEALLTTARILYRSFMPKRTGNCRYRTCPRSLHGG